MCVFEKRGVLSHFLIDEISQRTGVCLQELTRVESDAELKPPEDLSEEFVVLNFWINDECEFKVVNFCGEFGEVFLKAVVCVFFSSDPNSQWIVRRCLRFVEIQQRRHSLLPVNTLVVEVVVRFQSRKIQLGDVNVLDNRV